MKANVGIYKLHLGADGGGDKRALALAERLSAKHNVWLITGGRADLRALESYFDVDLSRVTLVVFDRSRRRLINDTRLRATMSARRRFEREIQQGQVRRERQPHRRTPRVRLKRESPVCDFRTSSA